MAQIEKKEEIKKTDKIDLGRISMYDFNSSAADKIQMDNKIEEMDKFWDSNGIFGEFNPEEIKISKDDLYGKIGKLYSDINRLKREIGNVDYGKEYISDLKREIKDNENNLKLFTEIAEKCWNLWDPLMIIRNLTWEIRYGQLNNDNGMNKEEYIKESIKKIKEIQIQIDKEFILDKEEYDYFYTDYLELKEEYNLI